MSQIKSIRLTLMPENDDSARVDMRVEVWGENTRHLSQIYPQDDFTIRFETYMDWMTRTMLRELRGEGDG